MRTKILSGVVILILLYGGVRAVEWMMAQELTRVADPSAQEAVCLRWKPRLLRGDGICAVEVRDAQDKVMATAELGTLDTAFNALQQYGQIEFQGQEITVRSLRTGELMQRFVIQNGELSRVN